MGIVRAVSTMGPLGRSPWAPGSVAAAVAAIVAYGATWWVGPLATPLLALLTVVAGQWAIVGRTDAASDPREVVIDEAAGQLVALLLVRPSPLSFVVSFTLFRAFDILKPAPIRTVERRAGAWAVMGDDLVAGGMARLVLLVVERVR